jgi:hypothetical protein
MRRSASASCHLRLAARPPLESGETCRCCGLRIRQARVSTGRMAKATAEAKVALGEPPTSRPYSASAPLEMLPHQLRHAGGLRPHPHRDERIPVCRLPPEPGLSDGLHGGTPVLFPQWEDAVGGILPRPVPVYGVAGYPVCAGSLNGGRDSRLAAPPLAGPRRRRARAAARLGISDATPFPSTHPQVFSLLVFGSPHAWHERGGVYPRPTPARTAS